MTRRAATLVAAALLAALASLAVACNHAPALQGARVRTEGAVAGLSAEKSLSERYPEGSRVVLAPKGGEVRALSVGLAAAGSIAVSPDGGRVVFAGRDGAHWTIYESQVAQNGAAHKLAGLEGSVVAGLDCGDPAYMGNSRVVFACTSTGPGPGNLYTVTPDGSLLERLTYGHGAAFDPHPLPDGRIRFTVAGGAQFTINPDGSELAKYFPDAGAAADATHDDVPLQSDVPPRGQITALDRKLTTGRLLCYDSGRGAPRASFVAAETDAGELGAASVDGDGSFFIEVPADQPVRLRTLDAQKQPIATCAWLWVRPGEVHGCFGCHEPHTAAPVNRLVAAVSHPASPLPAPAPTTEAQHGTP